VCLVGPATFALARSAASFARNFAIRAINFTARDSPSTAYRVTPFSVASMAARYSAKSRLPLIDAVTSLVRPSRTTIVPVAPAYSSKNCSSPSRLASVLLASVFD
jgi:hypothetical protein